MLEVRSISTGAAEDSADFLFPYIRTPPNYVPKVGPSPKGSESFEGDEKEEDATMMEGRSISTDEAKDSSEFLFPYVRTPPNYVPKVGPSPKGSESFEGDEREENATMMEGRSIDPESPSQAHEAHTRFEINQLLRLLNERVHRLNTTEAAHERASMQMLINGLLKDVNAHAEFKNSTLRHTLNEHINSTSEAHVEKQMLDPSLFANPTPEAIAEFQQTHPHEHMNGMPDYHPPSNAPQITKRDTQHNIVIDKEEQEALKARLRGAANEIPVQKNGKLVHKESPQERCVGRENEECKRILSLVKSSGRC
jgi:hypothetical protein